MISGSREFGDERAFVLEVVQRENALEAGRVAYTDETDLGAVALRNDIERLEVELQAPEVGELHIFEVGLTARDKMRRDRVHVDEPLVGSHLFGETRYARRLDRFQQMTHRMSPG